MSDIFSEPQAGRTQTQWEVEEDRLRVSLDRLEESVSILGARLAPVLINQDVAKVGTEPRPEPIHSPVVYRVYAAANRVESIQAAVRYLIDNLEV